MELSFVGCVLGLLVGVGSAGRLVNIGLVEAEEEAPAAAAVSMS